MGRTPCGLAVHISRKEDNSGFLLLPAHEVVLSESGRASWTKRLPLYQVAMNGIAAWQTMVTEAINLVLLFGIFLGGGGGVVLGLLTVKNSAFQSACPFSAPHSTITVSPGMLLKYFY